VVYEPPDGADDPYAPLRLLRRHDARPLVLTAGDRPPPDGAPALAALADSAAPGPAPAPAPDDPAMIFISSGTTGRPKASVAYHGNLCRRWQRLGGWLGFGPDDVHLAHLPLSHGFGLMMALAGLLAGGRLVLVRDAASGDIPRLIGAERATTFHGAPTHFKLLLDRLDPERHDVRSLRVSVGTAAPFAPPLVAAIRDRLHVKFMLMYGSSEGVGVATTDPDDFLLGSVGRPAAGSVAILGADGRPVPSGTIGEIAFARSVYPVRYWDDVEPDADGRAEWYHSGDFGRIDEAGRLYVFGRLKHQIDRGGLKVDPVEVEAALQRLPDVADAAVLGRPNPVLGETVCACVVPARGATVTRDGLRAALAHTLTAYKLPEELYLLEQIPRTPIGKVDLTRLRAMIAALQPAGR
jgi:acyl-CoA synthetase (AMP-forming)/AMP-acid ligase II